MKTLRLFCVIIIALFFSVSALAASNTNNAMVSGSFGIAWLDGAGIVHLYDGTNVTQPLQHIKIYGIAAADFLEEGSDQLAYLDDARRALHIHNFETRRTIGPFGHNIRTMATGQWSADETFPSLFVSTFNGASFRWTREVMSNHWHEIPGDFVQAARGRFAPGRNHDDFATVNEEGHVYRYSPMWQAYSRVVGAERIVAVLAGNFTVPQSDTIAMFDREGNVFLHHNRALENLGQTATCLAVWRNPNGLDALYAIDNEGRIVRYDRETRMWNKRLLGNDLVFTNLIVKDDQTIVAVSDGDLYKISGDTIERLSSLPSNSAVLYQERTLLARYRYISVPFKPYIDELRTPSGRNVLRDSSPSHPHHRALMLALGVNGTDFWHEWNETNGKQITTSFHAGADFIETEIDWNVPGKNVLKEVRKINAMRGNNATLLDWHSTFEAVEDAVLAGNHYFGLGMRFVQEMDTGGRFFNSTGADGEIFNGDERLTTCRWVAYTANVEGQPVTVAMFDHPSNPRPMVAFTMGDAGGPFAFISATMNYHRESMELKAGQSFAFKYRIALWDGDVLPEIVERAYADFATTIPTHVVLHKDGTSLARYRAASVPFKPYIDEMRTPSGKNILRDAPWDYLHHHAMMYAIRVGAYSFWDEGDPQRVGTQVTTEIQSVGNSLESQINWNSPESRTLLNETRKISVEQGDDVTLLDWQSTFVATEDTELGGWAYYGLGMRFVQEMDKDGRFFNSTGVNDGEIVRGDERLTACRWMAYTANLNGQPVTVAVFDHPSNLRPMVAFTMGDAGGPFAYLSAAKNLHRESVELKASQSFAVRYRVALWDGEVTPETIERASIDFVR